MNSDEILKAELAKAVAECERLREENARLRLRIGEAPEGAHQDPALAAWSTRKWQHVVFNCASEPQVTTIQNPARFDWEPLSKIDCYRLDSETILKSQSRGTEQVP